MLASDQFFGTMSTTQDSFAAAQVAEKVMRRVEIAKVARNLQDCLAFASFKAQHGWQDRTLRSIEPEVTEQLRRKRPFTDDDIPSEMSSSSEDFMPIPSIARNRYSQPVSTSFKVPDTSYTSSRKRLRSTSMAGTEKGISHTQWKQDNGLPQSSPPLTRTPTLPTQASFADSHQPQEDSPMFDVHSDEEEQDLPIHSFANNTSSSIISSSPPRTPPPSRRLNNPHSKQSGADLLLYLANSPSRSPAIHVSHLSSSSKEPPSTPPSQHSHLPSAMMHTPGNNLGLFNGALQTPGQNFNLADFCNVTPSPAQAQWNSRTPALAKTPNRLTRRGLNFDSLMPPSNSPNLQRKTPASHGLALQLGDELIPRS